MKTLFVLNRVLRGRAALWLAVCLLPLLLASCESGGNFSILGYSTRPNYSPDIHTVRVPIFKNETFYRGLEFQLTEAIIREIELKTPYKTVTAGEPADTELTGKITLYTKNMIVPSQLDLIRQTETTLTVEVVWRDLRPGHIGDVLSRPPPKPPGTELITPPVAPELPPVLFQSLATLEPELGSSLATARQWNVDKLARSIVSSMEVWKAPAPCPPPP
jgi:hypothetical protein